MTLFSRVFSPPSAPAKTLAEKIADLQTQSAEFIAGTALSDDEPALRIAAIEKLGVGEALFKLVAADGVKETAVRQAALQRIAQLIDGRALDFSECSRRISHAETALAVAALCSEVTYLRQAIASINDDALLRKLAVDGVSTRMRQAAAEAMSDPAQLKQLLREARGKDKNVYKIAKGKCDQLLAQEKAAADKQANIVALCTALERHRHQPFDALFVPTLEHHEAQWLLVASQAEPDIKVRIEQAIDQCRHVVAKHVQETASQAARESAVANADAQRQSMLGELRALLTAIYASESAVDVERSLADLRARWAVLVEYKKASKADETQFARLTSVIAELVLLIARHGTVLQQAERFDNVLSDADLSAEAQALRKTLAATSLLGDAVPVAASEAAAALQGFEQSRHDKRAAEENAVRQVAGLIRKAQGALNGGKIGPTVGMRRSIEQKLQALPVVPTHVTKQLQQLDEKLNLLQDWRSYAVAPKRIELIEQMEALIGSDEHPQGLADTIKRLQDEWKSISKGAGKGGTDDTDAEWQRFHQASQTAYQPCREYFAAQAKVRDDNLSKRQALLDRLAAFVAAQEWERADWREVARALRESKQQWRTHQPVERAANKPLQERFETLTADLQSRLDAEFAKNVDEKKSLIARAKRLLGSDDSRQAIDEIKRLQLDWKNVGLVARDDDQKLWVEFREHCDAVFAKRQQAHTEYVGALEESKRKAIALCDEAEQLSALTGADLLEGAKKLSALGELFEAVGELPKAQARDLKARFERALDQCERRVAEQRARDKEQAWNHVLEAGGKLREYRFAVSANAPADECEALKQAVQAFIDGVPAWPKGGLQAIKSELAKTAASDVAGNETALRTLCIRAEILTDKPTPPSDQAFRRNYQLQRLMQSMHHSRGSVQDELDAMVLEWIGVGATTTAVYTELLERFKSCRSKR